MSKYEDLVRSSSPLAYYKLNQDSDWANNYGRIGADITNSVDHLSTVPPSVGQFPGSIFSSFDETHSIPNDGRVYQIDAELKPWTIEFVVYRTDNNVSYITSDNLQVIYANGSLELTMQGFGIFTIRLPQREIHLVSIVSTGQAAAIIIDGEPEEYVIRTDAFLECLEFSVNCRRIGHFSMYDRVCSLDEISERYEAISTTNMLYSDICISDGGEFYKMTDKDSVLLLEKEITGKEFTAVMVANASIDVDGNLVAVEDDDPGYAQYLENGSAATPTRGTLGLIELDASSCIRIDDVHRYMSLNSGSTSFYVNAAAPGEARILTLVSYLSDMLKFKISRDSTDHITVEFSGWDNVAIVSYTSDTTHDLIETTISIVATNDVINIYVGDTLLEFSADPDIPSLFPSGYTGNLIFGQDVDYYGLTPIYQVGFLYFNNIAPMETTVFAPGAAHLTDSATAYVLMDDNARMTVLKIPYIRVYFDTPSTGIYSGHQITHYGVGGYITIAGDDYEATSKTFDPLISFKEPHGIDTIPSADLVIPQTGEFGNTVDPARISYQVSNFSVIQKIGFKIYNADGPVLKSEGSTDVLTPGAGLYLFGENYSHPTLVRVFDGAWMLPYADESRSGLVSAEEVYGTIELVASVQPPTTGYFDVFSSNDGPYLRASAGELTWSGLDTIQINGVDVTLDGSYAIVDKRPMHIIGVLTDAIAAIIEYGATGTANLADGPEVIFFDIATYDYAMTENMMLKHWGAASADNAIKIDERSAPNKNEVQHIESTPAIFTYSYSWETTGATR